MIIIVRKSFFQAAGSAYKIFIDDAYQGEIRNDEVKEFAVENGRHTVYAKVSCFKSKPLCVDINDSIVELEVGISPALGEYMISLIDIVFFRKTYLWLREVETVEEPPGDVE